MESSLQIDDLRNRNISTLKKSINSAAESAALQTSEATYKEVSVSFFKMFLTGCFKISLFR